MEEETITILQSDLALMVQNINDLSAAVAIKSNELERMAKMGATWVLKFHEQKLKVMSLERRVRELENGLPS